MTTENDEREARLKGLAGQMSDAIDRVRAERNPPPVLELLRGGRQEPQLSDAELVAVRRMLQDFEKIANGCPTARDLLDR